MLKLGIHFMAAILVAGSFSTAQAGGIQFGFTGVHALDEDTWSSMNDEGRRLFLEERVSLAARAGATVVRLGATQPWLVDMARVHAGTERNWTDADAAIQAMKSADLDLCLTLPELIQLDEMSLYQAYITRLAERYDGDTDFGIDPADVNYEFPDIDGSGALTIADWDASDAAILAWAEAHQVDRIEIGHEPRALEMTGQLPEDVYAQQLKSAKASLTGAGGSQQLVLAGSRLDDQSKSHFTNRFDILDPNTAPWFDLAVAHVFESTADVSQLESATHIAKFANWLQSIDHGNTPTWLGELALPSAPDAGEGGVFEDPRTSTRTQANGLIRLVMEAILEGYEAVLYAEPFEVASGGEEGPRTTTGLLTVQQIQGLEPMMWPVAARPAYTVWRWLVDRFGGMDPSDVATLPGLPVNARAARVSGQGWLLWYDWTMEVDQGAEYGGALKPVTLDGVTSPSLKVTVLWPEEAGTKLDEDGRADATWTETHVAVSGGSATIFLGRDPVWVEASDLVIEDPFQGDLGPETADTSNTPDGAEGQPDTDGSGGGGGGSGGCATGPASPLGFALWLAILALVTTRRRAVVGAFGATPESPESPESPERPERL
jgi:hypothetical protein